MTSVYVGGTNGAVIGARPGSLGEAIADILARDCSIRTFGPGREPTEAWGPGGTVAIHDTEWEWGGAGLYHPPNLMPFDFVVCTIGLNLPDDEDHLGRRQMEVNYHAVMAMAMQWNSLGKDGPFVVISSNSAHIARSPSIGYCASKAALSMGIRSLARASQRPIFYAWEFGLLEGTPMTAQTVRAVGPDVPLTRMRGLPNGIPVDLAARHVCNALKYGWKELNGTTLRIDAGEQ